MPSFQLSNDSAMTNMPNESHKSVSIVEGMLCEVRMPSQPISLRIFIWRISAALLSAAPSGPRSWCMHTPFILRVAPLNRKPCSLVNEKERTPKRVRFSSTVLPSLVTVVRSV